MSKSCQQSPTTIFTKKYSNTEIRWAKLTDVASGQPDIDAYFVNNN